MEPVTVTISFADVPNWIWIVSGTVVWYICALIIIREHFARQVVIKDDDKSGAIVIWLLSPLFFPCAILLTVFTYVATKLGNVLTKT